MGRLRATVSRIESISYVDDHQNQDHAHGGDITMMSGLAAATDSFLLPVATATAGYHNATPIRPARPVTVRIVCDEEVQQRVVSKLVNLRAYRIVAT